MKSLCGKRRKHPKTVMAWTTLLDDECSIPLLKQLTMNAVRLNTAKCSKIIVVQRWMNQNLHSTSPIDTSKIQAIIFGTRSLPLGRMKSGATFESYSKQFRLQNLYFKATWFRRTCNCVAQVSGYQNVKNPKIYTNRHLFNFSEECRFNTLSRLANVLTASEFPYVFCSYKSERTKTKRCCKKWTVGKCIFQGANFENCSVKS